MADSNLVRVGGLWKSKSGKAITGSLGQARIVIFPNDRKKGERDPDYIMYIAPSDRQPDGAAKPAATGTRTGSDEDIPF